jgi:hypothetical protein
VIHSDSPESIFILHWTKDSSQYSALKYSEILTFAFTFLLLSLQPTVRFSLLSNFLPFRPFLTQFPSIPPFPYTISFHSALSLDRKSVV